MNTAIFIFFILGLALGSFVNAFVWRTHKQLKAKTKTAKREYSIVHGRSMCPNCHHQLSLTDLIPVLSWLALRGRCRYCHKPISWQYPSVEVLTALLFVLSYYYWPYGFSGVGALRFAVWLILLVGFVAMIVYDLRWFLLPNAIIYPLTALIVIQVLVQAIIEGGFATVASAIIGLMCAGGIFYVLFQISEGQWIGGGDVKLGFLLGLILGGPYKSLLMIFLASLLGTVLIVPLLLSGRATRKTRIPFGPFLISAAIIVQLFGTKILLWYENGFLS